MKCTGNVGHMRKKKNLQIRAKFWLENMKEKCHVEELNID